MYPLIITRLVDLRVGDRLIAHSGHRYPQPLQVVAPLGIVPGTHTRGVQVQTAAPDGPSVLCPWQMDGQVLEIDRPTSLADHNTTEVGVSARCHLLMMIEWAEHLL